MKGIHEWISWISTLDWLIIIFFSEKKPQALVAFFPLCSLKKNFNSVIIQHFLMKGKVESLSFPSYACLDLLTHLSYLSVKKKLNLAIFSENSYYHLMFYSLLTKYTLKVYFLFTMFEYFFSFATFSPLCDASFFSTPLSTQRNLKLKGKKHFAKSLEWLWMPLRKLN